MKIEDVLNSEITAYDTPLLSPGLGRAWDNKASMTPSPWQETKGEYLMFYIGQCYQHDDWYVGLAHSKDLKNWRKDENNPLINFSQNGQEYNFVDCPSTIKHQGQYYLFYETKVEGFEKKPWIKKVIKNNVICRLPVGLRRFFIRLKRDYHDHKGISLAIDHARGRKVFLYISDNYLDFSKSKRLDILDFAPSGQWDSQGIFSPRVYKFKDEFYLLYGGSDGHKVCSGLAVSDDLLNWQRCEYNPILKNGEKGQWDENHALIVDIIELEDGYCGFYEGEDANNKFRIGIAYSKDLKTWIKYDKNPIVKLGPKDSFKERMVVGPRVIRKDDTLYLFHGAHNKDMRGYCGLVTLKGNK